MHYNNGPFVALRAKIRPIGSSLGVILPKRELDLRRLKAGDVVEIGWIAKPATRELFGVWKEKPAKIAEATA